MDPKGLSGYAEQQDEEITMLRSVVGDENFETVDVTGAWNKNLDKAFTLRIRPLSHPDTFALISVRFTATYPKTLPLLSLKECSSDVSSRSKQLIEKIFVMKSKELVGEQMIWPIMTEIETVLDENADRNEVNDAVPSLETERATQEAAETERHAEQLRQQETQRVRDEVEAEERLAAGGGSESANQDSLSMDLFTEDWNESQFWVRFVSSYDIRWGERD